MVGGMGQRRQKRRHLDPQGHAASEDEGPPQEGAVLQKWGGLAGNPESFLSLRSQLQEAVKQSLGKGGWTR